MSALVLHLELDSFDVVKGKEVVRDVSGHNNNGTLVGNVDLVADDTFGACASFDEASERYIEISSTADVRITGDVTLEAWVYIRAERTDWVRVVGKGAKDASRSYGLWYTATGMTTKWLFQRANGTTFNNCELTFKHPTSPFNAWFHVTSVVRNKKATLYLHDLQGKLLDHAVVDAPLSGSQFDNDAPVTIGCAPGLHLRHSGRIAHVRVHDGPRSQAEIEGDIASDRLALAPFRKSHPIDFRLYDDDDQAVIYISDDPKGHDLHLELRNTSTHVIQWQNGHDSKASIGNHHFVVRFRPGTLSDRVLKALFDSAGAALLSQDDQTQWDIHFPKQLPAATEAASLYLLHKGSELRPNDTRTLTLLGMSAAPGSGARGTLVEFLPAHLRYTDDTTPITGGRTQYVHITNQLGRKNIPLHVWLTKGNTVLNDGKSETALTLRISNGSLAQEIALEKKDALRNGSKFVISFDASSDGWGLTDSTWAELVTVTCGHEKTELEDVSRGQAEKRTTKEWELTFHERKVLKKRGEANNHLEITIGGIKTNSSGHANLYVKYEGIPGYQDGQFILTVEKSPLVCTGGHVGIGTPDPSEALHVNGRLRVDGGRTIVNGFDGDGHHWIKTNGPTESSAVFMSFIGAKNGEARAVQISPGGANSGLFVKKNGCVGILTETPEAPLHVNGNLRIDGTQTVVNGFDRDERHWIRTAGRTDAQAAFMAFIGKADGEAKGVQISPGGAGGGGLFVNNDGCVGIGDLAVVQRGPASPKLQIVGSQKPQSNAADGTTIGEFYSHDRRQGVGISANRVAAIGNGFPNHLGDQYLYLAPKGKGSVIIEGELQIASTHDLKIGGVLRNSSTNEPVVISCPTITDDQAKTALKTHTNALVFFIGRDGNLHWMIKTSDQAFVTSSLSGSVSR